MAAAEWPSPIPQRAPPGWADDLRQCGARGHLREPEATERPSRRARRPRAGELVERPGRAIARDVDRGGDVPHPHGYVAGHLRDEVSGAMRVLRRPGHRQHAGPGGARRFHHTMMINCSAPAHSSMTRSRRRAPRSARRLRQQTLDARGKKTGDRRHAAKRFTASARKPLMSGATPAGPGRSGRSRAEGRDDGGGTENGAAADAERARVDSNHRPTAWGWLLAVSLRLADLGHQREMAGGAVGRRSPEILRMTAGWREHQPPLPPCRQIVRE